MAQIVTAQFVGQTSCGFVREKYYEIEISAGRSGCLCVRDVQGQGFSITSPTKVEVSAPILNAEGASGDVKVQSISLVQHKHTSAAPGSESSQPLP